MVVKSAIVVTPEELEILHQRLLCCDVVTVDNDMRWLIEEHWPHLVGKLLPPKAKRH